MRSILSSSMKNSNYFSSSFYRFESSVKSPRAVYPLAANPGFQTIPNLNNGVSPNDLSTQILKGVNFEDYKECFGNKSTWEIVRAITVLKLCSNEKVADNSLKLLKCAQTVLGVRGLRVLFKPTLYSQFVGGEDMEELRACTKKLARTGLRAMLAATMEEDIGEGGDENVYDNNCQRILDSIDIVATEDIQSPMVQLKLSGLLSPDLLVSIGNFYEASDDKLLLIKALARGMSERKIDDHLFEGFLDEKKKISLELALQRFQDIGNRAREKEVKVLVDGEYTYLNHGLSFLTMAAVANFNRCQPVIWNTYQCYLKSTEKKLMDELSFVKELGYYFGAKLVRGAYMCQERERAKKLQIPDPVWENYSATCDNYNRLLSFLLEAHSTMGPQCQFIIASHNVDSIKFAVKKMEDLNVDRDIQSVCFGQLYGMCDQVSNPLMKAGLPVYKSIAYGRIDEVLPYLARRAVENKSVMQGARKELTLLNKELKRRVASTFKMY